MFIVLSVYALASSLFCAFFFIAPAMLSSRLSRQEEEAELALP